MYLSGIGEKVDDYFIQTIPHYHYVTGNHTCLWENPKGGLLAGMIVSTGTEPITVVDFQGNTWNTIGSPIIQEGVKNIPGQRIKMIGITRGNFVFDIKEIRKWVGEVEPNPCQ